MSTNVPKEEGNERLSRLKAMQTRRKEVTAQAAVAAPAAVPATTGAAGGAAGGGGRGAMIQKLRKFVSKPDGSIDQEKAKKAFQFIKRQAGDPSAPRHEQAKKILTAITNMDPEMRRKLLGGVGRGGGAGGGAVKGLGRKAGGPGAGGAFRGRRGGGAGRAVEPAEAAEGDGAAWFDDIVNKI